jgi:hypothetical protein
MIYPTIILDNFFNDPIKVIQFAKSLEYYQDDEGRWPGKRTKQLHEVDKDFFEQYGSKILSILYPTIKDKSFNCSLYFQKISKENVHKGWVHQDIEYDFTAIVYLSQHKECGTSLFDSKNITSTKGLNNAKKRDMYLNKNFKEVSKYLDETNAQFIETIKINSKFNRLIMFDGAQFHAAQKFIENNIEEERLTLIGFFNNIYFPGIKFNGVEHKRII